MVYPAAGYAALRTGEVRFNREHPPLMKLLTGATWLSTDLPVSAAPGWREKNQWAFGRHLLYGAGHDAGKLLARARFPVALLSGLLVLAVWGAARRLFGAVAGWSAAMLVALDPLVLAHAGLATTDLGAAALAFGATLAIPWAAQRGGRARVLAAGGLLGAALAAKFSTVVLLALLPVTVWLGRDRLRGALLRVAGMAGVAFLVVTATYGRAGPGPWLEGLQMLLTHDAAGHPAYAFGRWGDGGWWWYFPAAWAVKTPLILLAAQAAGLVWVLRSRRRAAESWALLLAAGLFGATAMMASLNLGVRHLLPVVPSLAVLGGGAAAALWGSRAGKASLLGAGALLAGGTLAVHPDEITDANLLVGGPDRLWRVLSDSNVDWGQALPSLARALEGRPVRRLYLGYFGTADPHADGLRYVWVPGMNMIERRVEEGPHPDGREWLAVSVTTLLDVYTERHSAYAWLRDRPMTAFPGHAIALYDVTGETEVFVRLGETALALGEPEAALAPLVRAAELRPSDVALHVLLARLTASLGLAAETDATCARAVALAGTSSQEAELCALLSRQARQPREAPSGTQPSGEDARRSFLIRSR